MGGHTGSIYRDQAISQDVQSNTLSLPETIDKDIDWNFDKEVVYFLYASPFIHNSSDKNARTHVSFMTST